MHNILHILSLVTDTFQRNSLKLYMDLIINSSSRWNASCWSFLCNYNIKPFSRKSICNSYFLRIQTVTLLASLLNFPYFLFSLLNWNKKVFHFQTTDSSDYFSLLLAQKRAGYVAYTLYSFFSIFIYYN